MSQATLMSAIDQALVGWVNTPILDPNSETEDAEIRTFLEPQVIVSRTTRLSVSDRVYREVGYVRLVLGCERGIGLSRPVAWADDLASRFHDRKIGDVKFEPVTRPRFDENNDNGTYFILTVLVPYTFDYRED
jgi:hypothetical protein